MGMRAFAGDSLAKGLGLFDRRFGSLKMSKSPADDVVSIYRDHAEAFVRQRGTGLIESAWLDAFLALLPVASPRVLDAGCGFGVPIAQYLIERGCRITGVDTSVPLLNRAKAAFPEHQWIAADMRRMAVAGPFDGLIAWHSFFHLSPENQRGMFEEFGRLAAPGAVLMFTSGPGLGEAMGEFEGRPLYHGSLEGDEYRGLLAANGFEVVRHVVEDAGCGGATVWLAKRVGAREMTRLER